MTSRISLQSAHIVTGSHFSQTFRLGYKLVLICKAKGNPRPTIKWYKEGAEMHPKNNAHVRTFSLIKLKIRSKYYPPITPPPPSTPYSAENDGTH